MLKTLFVLVVGLAVAASCNLSQSRKGTRKVVPKQLPLVRFNSEGKITIAQFADLHYGEGPDTEWGPEADRNSTGVINKILDYENPDMVIFTGDQVSGEHMYPNATDYFHILLRPLVERRYRWASVYGNHDIGENLTRLSILDVEQSYGDLCYTQRMASDLPGVTNYYIPIYPHENSVEHDPEKPVMLWWFFDSQGGQNEKGQQPHYIDRAVVQWFRNESRRLKDEWGSLPSLVFFHIPLVEYVTAAEDVSRNQLCTGLQDEEVTPQDLDTGIMPALLEAGGVRTIFVGHDHGNAWCCYHREIEVCFNRHTGYGGYGTWNRGSRIIQLDINSLGNQTNYVRMESGEIVDRFPKQ